MGIFGFGIRLMSALDFVESSSSAPLPLLKNGVLGRDDN